MHDWCHPLREYCLVMRMIGILTMVAAVGLASTSSAFTLPASSLAGSSCWKNVAGRDYDHDDNTLLLFASSKGSKKKKAKKSASARTAGSPTTTSTTTTKTTNNGFGFGSATPAGGKGFSTARPPKPSPRRHQDGPQRLTVGVGEAVPAGMSSKARRQNIRQKLIQDDNDNDNDDDMDETTLAETARLRGIYMEQFRQQEHLLTRKVPRRRIQHISQNIFTIDDFIDPQLCARVQSNGAGCFDLFFPEQLADLLFDGQESEMDGLLFNQASSRDHPQEGPFPDGLHMDTNGECVFRHVTAILYLNDIPPECGGATVFPLARTMPADPALAASRRLLAERISHTRSPSCGAVAGRGLQADAKLLEARGVGTNFGMNPDTETAIRIQPQAGRLLVFFSRDSNGEEDPRAWHAGERLCDRHRADKSDSKAESVVTEKRILTLFKQVDYANTSHDQPSRAQSTFEAFLAPQIREQQKWLEAKALSQSQL